MVAYTSIFVRGNPTLVSVKTTGLFMTINVLFISNDMFLIKIYSMEIPYTNPNINKYIQRVGKTFLCCIFLKSSFNILVKPPKSCAVFWK